MIHETSWLAVAIFSFFVSFTLFLSFYLGRRTKSAKAYFAAHGEVHWLVNGVAFAGDYLSAASFLGICGMIAFYGYDGFLYAIGYLAGWVVALLVVAEPMKRLGKYTFADAIDARFHSRGIRLAAATSTLLVSIFYLIPQMVGAGVLVQPLLGLSHAQGVLLVGAVVILIVTTAGMVSTTYVQFLKGSLLVFFSFILVGMILWKGLEVKPFTKDPTESQGPIFREFGPFAEEAGLPEKLGTFLGTNATVLKNDGPWQGKPYLRVQLTGEPGIHLWKKDKVNSEFFLRECQVVTESENLASPILINGRPKGTKAGEHQLKPVGTILYLSDGVEKTGALGPMAYVGAIQGANILLWGTDRIKEPGVAVHRIYYPKPTRGSEVLRPGNLPSFKGIRSGALTDKLNFVSLMLALFCGTASLPHILIRYYTVKDEAAARSSTVVGIATIGVFYLMTLFIGLGAMASGALDVTDSNMAAPLLARTFGNEMFAVISAIAFTTVLGTVSGLIVAASGAVAHDIIEGFLGYELADEAKVRAGKLASVVVGVIAIVLGIVFQRMNVNYLVGWAFSVAASANLPALTMLLFWRGTTKQGVIASISVGMIASLAWILLSADTYKDVYGLDPERAIIPFSQPGIVTIPLGYLVLVLVSLFTPRSAGARSSDGHIDPYPARS